MRLSRAIVLATTTLLLATGCSPGGRTEDNPRVVASFYPIFEAAARVGGDRFETIDLTPPGVEPHDLELTPDQVDLLLDAEAVFYLGRGFQPAVEQVVENANGFVVDLLQGMDLRDPEDDDQEEEADPHVWLDPALMAAMVERIRDTLVQVDPEGADHFRQGAAEALAELEDLDRALEQGLAGCEREVVVTAHAAFGYLTERYGLEQHAVSGLSPEAEPDPRRLAELADLVEDEGVTTIFTETLASPEVAETLSRETGADVAVLHPIESLTPDQAHAGEDYFSLMRANLDALRDALGCS